MTVSFPFSMVYPISQTQCSYWHLVVDGATNTSSSSVIGMSPLVNTEFKAKYLVQIMYILVGC